MQSPKNLTLLFFFLAFSALAIPPDQKTLPIGLAEKEKGRQIQRVREPGSPPTGEVHSLGEWEEADSAITLWINSSFIKALSERGKVTLLADGESDVQWWKNWMSSHGISQNNTAFSVIPTDSIWVRDYAGWYIVDGNGQLGMVDTLYNRPRPLDDKVPQALAKQLGLPLYASGLVHTGGNYYSDGLGNGFSSTLVYTENPSLSPEAIRLRMFEFLGIERYTTSRLAPSLTIEHLDTFGKLVAPDTWVFSQFPQGSRFKEDSDKMAALLSTLTSPYGTPYKIHRLAMVKLGSSDNYRAYINSFISNGTLYFPAYGDARDEEVWKLYAKALPGYEIVGVDHGNTAWGDSVHCRSNNLYSKDTLYIFPKVTKLEGFKPIKVNVSLVPTGGTEIIDARLAWELNGIPQGEVVLTRMDDFHFQAEIPAQKPGSQVRFFITAEDSRGKKKSHPIRAPQMQRQLVL